MLAYSFLLHTNFQGRHSEGKNIKAPGSLILFRLVCAIFLLQQQHTFYIYYLNREGFRKCGSSLSAFTEHSQFSDILGNIYYLYKKECVCPVTCFGLSITVKFKMPDLKLPASFIILRLCKKNFEQVK